MKRKLTIITGASRGIGKAIADKFGSEGYDLVLTCKSSFEDLKRAKAELEEKYQINCGIYQVDMGICDEVTSMFSAIYKEYSSVDILINNAAISYVGLLSDMSAAEWDLVMKTNVSSVFYCCKQVIPCMVRNKRGKIINISSVWGEAGASCEVAYSASKGAVNALTKALAKELAPSNIQVNALSLGAIDTKMNAFLTEEERLSLVNEIPANRLGTTREVAEEVYSLSQRGSYLTGQIIRFDGGWI